jgi:hypothetical protein
MMQRSAIALLLLLAGACGPPREDVDAARALIKELDSTQRSVRYNHSNCLAAVRAAKSPQDSESQARDLPFCVSWREAETKRTELRARLQELCQRAGEACRRAEALERSRE